MTTTGGGRSGDRRHSSPPAAGVRRPWHSVPVELRHAVEQRLGAPVADAISQPGGFSPGVAARLRFTNGARAFVKAVGPEPNPESPGLYRAEARIAAALPAAAPAPRLLGSIDRDGWVLLIFEDIAGLPPAQPWNPSELARVFRAVADMAAVLTPAPIDAPSVAVRFGDALHGWRRLNEAHSGGDADLTGLDPWARRHLARLATAEAGWSEAAEGTSLVHADLRADNVLLTDDRVFIIDWPWACIAAPWFDLVSMLPSVRMQGGPPPQTVFDNHPVARGSDRDAVTAVLTALAGFFVWEARQPAPPGLPTLRAFQGAQGEVAITWLRIRTGWQ